MSKALSTIVILVVCLVSLQAQTTQITCWYQKIDTNYCPTCPDAKSYEVFTGIKIEFADTTYRIYPPYKVYDEDTFYVIQDVYNTQIYFGENTVTYANKFEIAEAISACMADTSGASGTNVLASFSDNILTISVNGVIDTAYIESGSGADCNTCCDSLFYFRNDSIAHAEEGFNKFDYYTTALINDYGWSWGFLRQIITDVGFEIISGMVVAIESVVGFTGRDPRCKFNAPPNTLSEYRNDSTALANGLIRYVSWYKLSEANDYGAPKWTIKRVSE